jgi:hypothetical protein
MAGFGAPLSGWFCAPHDREAVEATKLVLSNAGGFIPMMAQMQILYKSNTLRLVIETGTKEVAKNLPAIQIGADEIMRSETAYK